MFIKCGVQVVVLINEEHAVDSDLIGRKICKEMYGNLLQGASINSAFNVAVGSVQNSKIDQPQKTVRIVKL